MPYISVAQQKAIDKILEYLPWPGSDEFLALDCEKQYAINDVHAVIDYLEYRREADNAKTRTYIANKRTTNKYYGRSKKYRCKHCAYLVEDDNGNWFCEDWNKNIYDVADNECAVTKED